MKKKGQTLKNEFKKLWINLKTLKSQSKNTDYDFFFFAGLEDYEAHCNTTGC